MLDTPGLDRVRDYVIDEEPDATATVIVEFFASV